MSMNVYQATIFAPPITKKNSQRIIRCGSRPMIIPSAKYKEYEKVAGPYLKELAGMHLEGCYTVKTVFYMPTRRRVDLSNLIEAIHDILVKYDVLADDNCRIIVSVDGSRVKYDKENPRTEITITEVEE